MSHLARRIAVLAVPAALAMILTACGKAPGASGAAGTLSGKTLNIGAIPDQNPQELQRRYGALAAYLAKTLHVKVRYVPVTDYTAAVTAFRHGDLDLAFFGGLTGVQARQQVQGPRPIAQPDLAATRRSVFIANTTSGLKPVSDVAGLRELAGHTFTFGSQSSTSGRLMPQYYLAKVGVKLSDFAGQPGFSGSHDITLKLVEAGTYQAGALNIAVWKERLGQGVVDTRRVRVLFETPPYHDYFWLIRPHVGPPFGASFTQRVRAALLSISGRNGQQRQILSLFQCRGFVPTDAGNYREIAAVARSLGLLS